MAKTNIEWTDDTWNPIVGCSIKSPGCINCYAMGMAARIQRMNPESHYDGTTEQTKTGPVWTGLITFAPQKAFYAPLHWAKSKTVFVNSMGDLFHESIADGQLDLVFAIMALGWHHTFQVLTKRSDHMKEYVSNPRAPERIWKIVADLAQEFPDLYCDWMGRNKALQRAHGQIIGSMIEDATPPKYLGRHLLEWPLRNVWLGVSAERQEEWDERKGHLAATPAVVRFASFEPLLGPIVEPCRMSAYLNWAIVGGESGAGARPMDPDWARSLRDQCTADGVPFFFKQWGMFAPATGENARMRARQFGRFDAATDTIRVGKKAAGRMLDGREHNEMPKAVVV